MVNASQIKLAQHAAQFAKIAAGAEPDFVSFLAGNDAAASKLGVSADALGKLRDALAAENNLLIVFGPELRGQAIDALVAYGAPKAAKFICLADYANSRGAADMGLYPDLLPGYRSVEPAVAQSSHSRPYASGDARRSRRRNIAGALGHRL